ncbi:MAG: hypothetical protein ABIJ97_12425, partial [Bacteroidota bacterium]
MLNFKIIASLIFIFSTVLSFSQEQKESPFNVGADLMSRYVWRGTDYGTSPSIQPTLEYNKKGFVIGTWGAFTTNIPGNQEVDIYMNYTFLKEMVTVYVTDYFVADELSKKNNYFEYNDTLTGHIYEVTISFNGTEKLPVSLLIASNIYGADARKTDGSIQYSSYAEINYAFKHLNVFAGFNIVQPNRKLGETGFYGDYVGFVNIGCEASKEIKITDNYSLPLSVSFITNPQSEKVFLVVG